LLFVGSYLLGSCHYTQLCGCFHAMGVAEIIAPMIGMAEN